MAPLGYMMTNGCFLSFGLYKRAKQASELMEPSKCGLGLWGANTGPICTASVEKQTRSTTNILLAGPGTKICPFDLFTIPLAYIFFVMVSFSGRTKLATFFFGRIFMKEVVCACAQALIPTKSSISNNFFFIIVICYYCSRPPHKVYTF